MSMYLAGLRVGECAALTYGDVVDSEGAVRNEIRLTPEQTKGRHARVVFVSSWPRVRRKMTLMSGITALRSDRRPSLRKSGAGSLKFEQPGNLGMFAMEQD